MDAKSPIRTLPGFRVLSGFSLAPRRRTIHTDNPTPQALAKYFRIAPHSVVSADSCFMVCSIQKALTDGMFTVLFSTTPLSASRNYSVNIPSVNAFLSTPFRPATNLRHSTKTPSARLTEVKDDDVDVSPCWSND